VVLAKGDYELKSEGNSYMAAHYFKVNIRGYRLDKLALSLAY